MNRGNIPNGKLQTARNHEPTSKLQGRMASLDGLRAIAVGLVLAGHGAEAYIGHERSAWLAPFVNSSLGVRLFFVLSGFLMNGVSPWVSISTLMAGRGFDALGHG